MQIEPLLAELEVAGRRLLSAAVAAGYGAAVPSCPGWTVTDLLCHVCRSHAWAVHTVRGRPVDSFLAPVADLAELPATYSSGLQSLLKTLQSARDSFDTSIPFEAPSGRQFWARRMAHETTVHRLDAELAGDTGMFEVPAAFAADGIDELLRGFAPTFTGIEVSGARGMTVMPLDVNRAWTLTFSSTGFRTAEVATDRADLVVAGMSSDLYRWLWNRAPDDVVSLTGDARLADLWHRSCAVVGRV